MKTPVDKEPALVPDATMLLVDDNAAFRDMTDMALDSLGYTVQPCASPRAALEYASRSAQFTVLITDVIMAKMNGVQLAAEVRRIRPEIKVLFCSGYPIEALARQGLDCSSGEFLMKPTSISALGAKISALSQPRADPL